MTRATSSTDAPSGVTARIRASNGPASRNRPAEPRGPHRGRRRGSRRGAGATRGRRGGREPGIGRHVGCLGRRHQRLVSRVPGGGSPRSGRLSGGRQDVVQGLARCHQLIVLSGQPLDLGVGVELLALLGEQMRSGVAAGPAGSPRPTTGGAGCRGRTTGSWTPAAPRPPPQPPVRASDCGATRWRRVRSAYAPWTPDGVQRPDGSVDGWRVADGLRAVPRW